MRRLAWLGMTLAPAACELTTASLAVPEDALVVESHVVWIGGFTNQATARVFVHGTAGSSQALTGPPDVQVTITGPGGVNTVLAEQPVAECVIDVPPAPEAQLAG